MLEIGELDIKNRIIHCELSGHIGDIDYKKEEILISRQGDNLLFFKRTSEKLINKVLISECQKLVLKGWIILYDGLNIFNINTSRESLREIGIDDIEDIDKDTVGYTTNNIPFFIGHDERGIMLLKSLEEDIITIKNHEIDDIIINNETNNKNENFKEIEIRFLEKSIRINVCESLIQKLIRNTFVYSKEDILKKASMKDLYMNWSKSMNDIILFDFFGDLYYTKLEIDKIIKESKQQGRPTLGEDEKVAIVNILYYQIQNQKNQFDAVAAYMPKIMEVSDLKLFSKFDKTLDIKVFKLLQKQLFTISRQLNRYLNDIEKNLSQITFSIYDEIRERKYLAQINTKEFGIGMGISNSIDLALGRNILVPLISKDAREIYKTKNIKNTELSKLNVFTHQSIDKLNHLIDTMYPYYVEEANTSLFNLFKTLEKEYSKLGEGEKIKDILFKRITDLYLYKQLSLNPMTNLRRKDLINKISVAIDRDMCNLDEEILFIGGE